MTLKENYKHIYNVTSPRHSRERLQHHSWVGIGRELNVSQIAAKQQWGSVRDWCVAVLKKRSEDAAEGVPT